MKYYRLEYNEKTGDFHFEDNKLHPENLNGWRTISRGISENKCMRFVEMIKDKYSVTNDNSTSFWIIQQEFFSKNMRALPGTPASKVGSCNPGE